MSSRLDDILDDFGHRVVNEGLGEHSRAKLPRVTKQQIKDLMHELVERLKLPEAEDGQAFVAYRELQMEIEKL